MGGRRKGQRDGQEFQCLLETHVPPICHLPFAICHFAPPSVPLPPTRQRPPESRLERTLPRDILPKGGRHDQAEHRPAAHLTDKLDFALKDGRELLADRQPQARPRVLPRVPPIKLVELL